MSTFISNAFVQQYADNFTVLAQQSKSRLENLVRRRSGNVIGSSFVIDTLGKASDYTNKPRHADLTYANIENQRRYGDMIDAYAAELIDEMDKIKLLIEPSNPYIRQLIAAINRRKDAIIIKALGAAVRTDSGTTALPAGQKIAVGGTGLTIAKLRQAKLLLDDAQMDDGAFYQQYGVSSDAQGAPPSYIMVCRPKDIDNLLGDTTVTSSDYNTIKALVNGTLNTFMGFKFVTLPSTTFEAGTASDTLTYAYAPKVMEWGVGIDTQSMLERIPQKDAYQAMAKGSFGCARSEDEGVVQIATLT